MSFFHDDEDETHPTAVRPAHTPPRQRPRRPQRTGGPGALDQHTLTVRRRMAAAVGVVLLIVIVLVVNGCLKSRARQALENYNQNVGQIAGSFERQVSRPFFSTLVDIVNKPATEVFQIDQLRNQAQSQVDRAKSLNVPAAMAAAQRNLLLALDLRVEGLTKLASLVRTAIGGQAKQASTPIAGDMELFLTSDVIYSQRVAPLIQQTLASNGIHGQSTASSHYLPNLGWLDPTTALARMSGQAAASGPVAPGSHGHALAGVSVGTNTLAPSPTLNHITGGTNPTFTVMVQNTGSNPEANVKVDITVATEGKELRGYRVINKTEPGNTASVDIPVEGVTLGAASKIMVNIEAVPGETSTEKNKGTYLAIFEH